ncbi:Autoinducer synthesis protein AhlI [Pseudomonas caricapapayae]|uniref:Acyl-homoserine-lactone synthase n=1 Tax=Pseudomonas caricapapayae TaxID=46678 RepID=A0A0P9KF56_9PSED|nr:acyl-homoserine-lactone synthase [Pseudomonas caricapapayae]KAA8690642.1 acyl-homoserine-lactone synthase [Pseudomonas caricapapayae]KPW54463.1 Autoinducer synthesis protein AhlI [Pseudomonas caricapapayae]RMM10512.1 Autoinducer synthesis protein AhlI [Pseudomonas caricapapayae]RMW00735.1 Autoinducer synthesis protein AhlI [Pseudomonas caricapapayae]
MSSGFEFQIASYNTMPVTLLETLYSMRKKIFSDRLEWNVRVSHAFEFDEYDSATATYLIGRWNGIPLAGLRLINTCDPYMLEGPFRCFFDYPAPKNTAMAESSRFFVDTARARSLGILHAPLTEMLLFSMHNHAALSGLQSIITVVSKAMARIVRKSGWEHRVLSSGEASPGETVLLLEMPVTADNHQRLLESIALRQQVTDDLLRWPVTLAADASARACMDSAA